MQGKRANSEFLYSKEERQFYVKKKKLANGVVSLICRTSGCKNHCYLDEENKKCSLPVPYVPHTHPTKEEEYKRLCVLNKIKSDCANPNIVAKTETKTSVVKSIFKETITENEDSSIQYHRIERTLRRIANKTMPAAPKTIDQIGTTFENEHVNRLYGQTLHKSDTEKNQFYRTTHVSDEYAYSVFASQRCIDLIEAHYQVNERRYNMDATFKVVPRLFYQLLIIYFETPSKQTVPFIFVLMTRKTEESYRHIFKYIDENVFSLKCKSFMTDFELPMRNALKSVYPNSDHNTCWFHLTQAAKKNMSKLSTLSKLIRRNDEARTIYKKLLALPLLPADLIVETFHKLKTLALSKFKQFKTYLAYFERQWLQREGANKISVFLLITRSQAAVEAYNGYLGRKIIAHANFFVLINALRDEEFHKSREFGLLLSTANPPLQRRHYRIQDDKIRKISEMLQKKQIDVDGFLNGITCPDNNIFSDEHFDFLDDGVSDDEDETEPIASNSISSGSSAISGKTCVICLEATSDVLLSCGHYKYCLRFFELERANFNEKLVEHQLCRRDIEPTFKCPLCQAQITSHMHVKKIFVD
ncbi:uncharacterized protein LOC129568081 isoform X2 [Sitodiplosis mosellana]|nr:uncharacterized protein LOC129568081 isoform X2 [Sitodiplosis mosellana]XP_055301599.1 uncharacterized protein LOC129568081 isoform X2 [Sitodiplosis mosellana]